MIAVIRVGASRIAAVAAIVSTAGCLDLAHTNPYDPATEVTLQVSGPDSTYSAQEIAQFEYASDPVWSGPVQWKTSNDRVLHPLGDGRYGVLNVVAPPNDTASVIVLLGTHVASHLVVVTQRVTGFYFDRPYYGIGAGTSTFEFILHDANGYGTAVALPAQLVSSQPSVVRIDSELPGGPATRIFAVTPLALGNAYFIMSSGSVRDSTLVTVVP